MVDGVCRQGVMVRDCGSLKCHLSSVSRHIFVCTCEVREKGFWSDGETPN